MTALLLVWFLAALGGAALGLLGYCLVSGVSRAFVQAAFIDEDPVHEELAVVR